MKAFGTLGRAGCSIDINYILAVFQQAHRLGPVLVIHPELAVFMDDC